MISLNILKTVRLIMKGTIIVIRAEMINFFVEHEISNDTVF